MPGTDEELVLHRASLVIDGAGVDAAPGVLLRRGCEVVAAGSPQAIGVPASARVVEHAASAILPALGNAHAHMDLTALEPWPFDGNFPVWLGRVRDFRRHAGEQGARDSIERGAQLSLAGGVALIGDVVSAPEMRWFTNAMSVLRRHHLHGVCFLEVFGVGATSDAAMKAIAAMDLIREPRLDRNKGADPTAIRSHPSDDAIVRAGVQPHAPYSTSNAVVERALQSDHPFSIHLAETADEVEYARFGTGPLRAMLASFGVVSNDRSSSSDGAQPLGPHPVEWLCARIEQSTRRASRTAATRQPPRLAVHLNEIDASHAALLSAHGITAVYCPRASAYFGRQGMPWRDLRSRGVRVALGTDGRLCLDTPKRISTLDEIRFLAMRDGATLAELLPLATTEVARALGFDARPFTLAPGRKPGLLLVPCGDDPRRAVIASAEAPSWLVRASEEA
jgi:aminodeoxyfutalosine deaminase